MDVRTTNEDPIQIHDGLPFVTSQQVSAGETHVPAYKIEGPDNYVLGVEANTPLGPEFRNTNGEKLDSSTQVVLQKADPQGNPLGNAIVFEHNLDAFDYEKMRSDPRFFKHTQKSLMLDEREFLYVYIYIPEQSDDTFSPTQSRLTVGDNVTQTGKAVYIKKKDALSAAQQQAVTQANTK